MKDTRAELLRKLEKVDPKVREILLMLLEELDKIAEEIDKRYATRQKKAVETAAEGREKEGTEG